MQTMVNEDAQMRNEVMSNTPLKNKPKSLDTNALSANSMLEQVVGVILGSPEFQRK